MYRVLTLLIFIIIPFQLRPQVLPKENGRLNYRIIGFSFPEGEKTKSYQIEIAKGNFKTEDLFAKNVIISQVSKTNKIIAEVPSFGSFYTWRIVYTDKKKEIKKSDFYHFSTIMNARVDTTKNRLNILQPAEVYKDAYVTVEGAGIIYDMKGNPVWCLPDSGRKSYNALAGGVADVKFTPQGTITFLIDQTGYEINYNGDVLWQTPSFKSDTGTDFYNHEFTRLSNGHYMALGTEFIWYSKVKTKDSSYFVTVPDTSKHNKYNGAAGGAFIDAPGAKNRGRYGTIVELDENGNIVWYWKSSKYLMASDYVNYWPREVSLRYEPHENGFYFDEENKVIYLSYRQLSRIIKIEYPSGKVLNTYGEIFKKGVSPKGNGNGGGGLFCMQHSIRRSKDGYIYLFNNNFCAGTRSTPSIVMMREPATDKDTLEKVWEYKCPIDGYIRGFYSGGIGTELPDKSMYICLGSDYAKLLIVNHEQKVLWSALPEVYNVNAKKWEPSIKIYRSALISRKDLERLIWQTSGNDSHGNLSSRMSGEK